MVINESNPENSPPKEPDAAGNGEKIECMFSPGFRSVAAMAGWDEEAILIASLVVEDTPDRDSKHKKRSSLLFKTPPTNSRRKRRAQKRSPKPVIMPVLDLGEDETIREESEKNKIASKTKVGEEKKLGEQESTASSSNLPCIDRLREELSCAICLDICFEPSTTSCGHSFCKKCLCSAADKCGKRCPKCRQLISNGRSCTVNTVLWNTIQLLFPQEIEARKATKTSSSRENDQKSSPPPRGSSHYNVRNRSIQALNSPEDDRLQSTRRVGNAYREVRNHGVRPPPEMLAREGPASVRRRRRRGVPNQDEDAALALRLQREEFMGAVRGSDEQYNSSVALARENLRAMASRAMNIRIRGRPS